MIVAGMEHMLLGMDRVSSCAAACNVIASSNTTTHALSPYKTPGFLCPTNPKSNCLTIAISKVLERADSSQYSQPRGRYPCTTVSSRGKGSARNRGWSSVQLFANNKGLHGGCSTFRDMRAMCSSYAEGETADADLEDRTALVDHGKLGETVRLNSSKLAESVTSEEAVVAELASADEKLAAAEKVLLEAQEALQAANARAASLEAEIERVRAESRQELAAARVSYEEQLAILEKEKVEVGVQLSAARDEALDLAVKVEKMAEIAVQEATARIAEEAQLQIATAQTAAADATLEVEERIRKAAEEAAASVINEAKATIEEAVKSAEIAKQHAKMAEDSLKNRMQAIDELAKAEVAAMAAEEAVAAMERQLRTVQGEVERLTGQLLASEKRAEMAEAQVLAAEASIVEIQKAADKHALEREERTQRALEAIRSAAQAKEEAAFVAYNAETEQLRAVAEAAAKGELVKERALIRRCVALERSLAAAEISKKAWEDRALAVENLLRMVKEKGFDVLREAGEVDDILCNGRLETTLGSQKRKWDLLANGPRHLHPWASIRRSPGGIPIPPRKTSDVSAVVDEGLALHLPKPEDVLDISQFNIKTFGPVVKEEAKTPATPTMPAVEKALEQQRESLEKTLQKNVHKEVKQRPWLIRQKPPEDSEDRWESGTGNGKEIVFQGFNWESWRRKWYLEIAPKAADMAKSGITTIWLPPPTQSVAPQGYMPSDLYNLNSAYGTEEELRFCIDEMHAHGIQVLGDVVLNHRCAQKQSPNGVWNIFGGKMAWGPEAIVRDDPNFQGRGNPSSGDIFHAAPNIDHAQEFVRRDIKEWLKWLRTDIGYDGWRLDFVRGFWGGYVKEYIEASTPNFAIGEYWDSLAYDGGQVSYNQDAHRQRIINWVNATGGSSSAFDVTTKGILHSALHNEYWRLIDPQGKPPGVMGWWPSRAITFLENHDTGSTQGHWPFPRDKIEQGYAYILTHPGTPVIFYDHFYDFGLHDAISDLIAARTRTGVHCRSPVRIFHATAEGYVAQCGDNLVIKLGHIDWNPSKQINLVGRWEKFCDKGSDYQLWERR